MRFLKSLFLAMGFMAVSGAVLADNVKVEGTRFTLEVPSGWQPGYKDLDALFMIYFKDPKSGAVLEAVYQRGVQASNFTADDFKMARIAAENKRYDGKGHMVVKEGEAMIAGEKSATLLTSWKEGAKDMEKHTALYLKDGNRFLIVMWGEKGKVDTAVWDHAMKTFALVK